MHTAVNYSQLLTAKVKKKKKNGYCSAPFTLHWGRRSRATCHQRRDALPQCFHCWNSPGEGGYSWLLTTLANIFLKGWEKPRFTASFTDTWLYWIHTLRRIHPSFTPHTIKFTHFLGHDNAHISSKEQSWVRSSILGSAFAFLHSSNRG